MDALSKKSEANIKAAFRKCGIVPFDPEEGLKQVPSTREETQDDGADAMHNSFEEYLREVRFGRQGDDTCTTRQRTKRLDVPAGKRGLRTPRRKLGGRKTDEENDNISDSSGKTVLENSTNLCWKWTPFFFTEEATER